MTAAANAISDFMRMESLIQQLAGMVLGALAMRLGAAGTPSPSILIILADDLGYSDRNCYDAAVVATPHVDRLAPDGLRFRSAYATASTRSLSRYSLLTGEYALRQESTAILPSDATLIIAPGRSSVSPARCGLCHEAVGKCHFGLGMRDRLGNWSGVAPGLWEIGFDYAFSRNLLPVLLGETARVCDRVLEHTGALDLRTGTWKLIPPVASPDNHQAGNETGKTTELRLYDLAADFGETHKLAAKPAQTARIAEFSRLLTRERACQRRICEKSTRRPQRPWIARPR